MRRYPIRYLGYGSLKGGRCWMRVGYRDRVVELEGDDPKALRAACLKALGIRPDRGPQVVPVRTVRRTKGAPPVKHMSKRHPADNPAAAATRVKPRGKTHGPVHAARIA